MQTVINIGLIILGGYIAFAAAKLSVIYNGWTTGVRQRHPGFNPPRTPEWRKRNTAIMTWIFRIGGILLIIRSLLLMIAKP